MKSKFTIITVICLGIILVGMFQFPPDGHTGAPGDSLCTACHGGNNPFGFNGGIEISGLDPVITPGATYTVSVIVSNPNGLAQRAGFQIVALDDNNNNIGTMSNPSPNSTLSTQGGRTYFKHNPGVNFPGSNEVEWTVEWTAPSMTNSETVSFYGAGNIADGNMDNTNDFIVTTDLEVDIEQGVDPLEIEIISSSDVSCFGGLDGMAEAQASGGEGNYSYLWSNGETGPQAMQLGAGISEVTVTDDVGSTASVSVEINQPDELVINLNSLIDVSCFQGSDGAISVSGQGGVGNYSFNWSNGGSGQQITNLNAGNYSVVLTDGNNCTVNEEYTITEPDPISITPLSQDIVCYGMENGEISLIVSGGTTPYTVAWSDGSQGLNLTGLPAGEYFYGLTDANGCEEEGSVIIEEPDPISITPISQDITCYGMESGEISLVVSGGITPYTVDWSDGSQGLNLTELSAGEYFYTLTDANNCEEVGSVILEEPDPISITPTSQEVTCYGLENGEISLVVSGGITPYTVDWSDGSQGLNLTELSAGEYFYTLTDATDCEEVGLVTVDGPDEIELSITFENPSCLGCDDGSATVSAVGGVGNFSYSWNTDPPQNTAMAENLTAGTYTVTVTDGNNCESTAMVTLTDPGDCLTEGGFYYNQNEVNCTSGSLQNLCFEIPESIQQDSFHLCNTTILITNPLWYNFVAGDSSFHVLANIDDCSIGNGLRIAVFELNCNLSFDPGSDGVFPDGSLLLTDCDWMLNPQSGAIEIEVETSPGKVYGLMIEGYEEDQCTFTIEEVIKAGDAPQLENDDLEDIQWENTGLDVKLCEGVEGVEFFLENGISTACSYIWTVENVDTGELEILENNDPLAVFVDFPEAGIFNICVAASNICDTTDYKCLEVEVITLDTFYAADTICKRTDYIWIGPFGVVIDTIPGTDSAGLYTFEGMTSNQFDCELEINLSLYVLEDNIDDKTAISAVICSGEEYEMPDGSVFTETGFYGEDNSIFINQVSEPGATYGCDSFFTLELIVLDVEITWDEVICSDNEFFITPNMDISPNPLFLPDLDDVEYQWQWIRLSDGDTIATGGSQTPDTLDGFLTLHRDSHFVDKIETFEWHLQMSYDGQPDGGCSFIAGSITIDTDDYYPEEPDLAGPDHIFVDSLLSLMVLDPDDSVIYIWEVLSDPEDYTVINDSTDTVLELIFHSMGIHEICVYAENECGSGEKSCKEIEVEMRVSTEDTAGDLYGVRIFPNPAKDFLIIDSEVLGGDLQIRIFDETGQLIIAKQTVLENRHLMQLTSLNSGMYIISLTHEKGELNQVFYKQ